MVLEVGFTEPAGYLKLFFILGGILWVRHYFLARNIYILAITRLYAFLLYLVIARFCSSVISWQQIADLGNVATSMI